MPKVTPAQHFRRGKFGLVLGITGGIGKSTTADTIAFYLQTAGVSVRKIRLESGARRQQFKNDEFVDLDLLVEAESAVGGISAAFDPSWAIIETAVKEGAVVVFDVGANGHNAVLRLAAETSLSSLIADRGGQTYVFVLVTRDADLIGQSANLVADVAERMPQAKIVLVLNERAGPFVGDFTREGRAYSDVLAPLLDRYAHVKMPLAGAKSIAAFSSSGRSIPEILAASEAELRAWSGLGLLAALSCQAHIGAWWLAVTDQLATVFPCPDDA